MNEQYVSKCNEIFERKCEKQNIRAEFEQFREFFNFEISIEYQYILESFAGMYIREDYGFKALGKTPLTDKNGFDRVSYFFPLKGRNNIFAIYEKYEHQLPIELIPIGELDGGNLLCINRVNRGIYIWIHDEEGKNIHLVQENILDFIYSFELLECETDADLGIVETKFSASFLDALKNYKK